jgi:hypothetical protein
MAGDLLRGALKPSRRYLIAALSLAAHAGLIAVLIRAPTPHMPSDLGEVNVALVDGPSLAPMATPPHAAASAPAKPVRDRPRPVPPPDVVPQYVKVVPPADPQWLERDPSQDPVGLSVAASAASGQDCQVAAWLQQALQANGEVQAALAAVPRADRSVANALMLWDARWVAQSPSAVAGVSVVRAALAAGVRAAPDRCRMAVVRGPELITVADATGTTLLAIGSGEWRWADLLADDDPAPTLIAAATGR